MKKLAVILIVSSVAIWLAFGALLLGKYSPQWLPVEFQNLILPKTSADFGQSFSVLEGLLSSLALAVGLLAIFIQVRQTADSNVIGAFAARQQYLLLESDRLERQIKELKCGNKFDPDLFNNMVDKKRRLLAECHEIDKRLHSLLERIKT